ncbi:MAG TPA: UDP-glucose/GDP-mannose dehydrogenase family protein [Chitinophagales bacterium]|jgi:UDPglucose 6-dehydrogenase|nr:UDP-glucose/GDP-mannose dehydrogenase family protein [Chitinophagales bacterium]HQV76979.1 UDP-glucose/GDP-mannose dehydrogenase family protein [Chitinophagales bacterium]HQW77954.1 UDP-glucose/GDP-mannose dehydrogenase family protein [Chitinophagales bacterium]HRB67218.1 UDP-glucose/GDP-mannose dehydrogenase family protein [Chitinophagales bacterium]HRB69293.1 UDP-glucose/GDP-mannose dehydrogenase family protein [Chitinophagales bacterium]
MNIAVVGTGYVGLVSGTCLAETGNNVICVDIDANKVAKMKAGQIPIYEPGLEILFHRNIKEGRLHFTTDLEEAIKGVTLIFLALPTPPGEDGAADLKYVLGVAEQLGKIMKDYKVIINKSTVPVGTAEKTKNAIAKHATVEFDVVSNPEFLREGVAVDDFMKPDRVVVGTRSERARKLMEELYRPFVRQGNPIIFMDERSSEMTKYAANSYLAARISFMNELANLCEKTGADVETVRQGMGTDNRIGKRFLFPGIGYGGSCFPKDVQALAKTADEHNYDFKILKAVMQVNENQKHVLVEKIINHFGTDLNGKKIAIWGLAFKPNTDDIREAPALYIIKDLLDAGAEIVAYDPEGMPNVQQHFSNLTEELKSKLHFSDSYYNAIEQADFLAILTEWTEFRTPDFARVKAALKAPVIFDGRNLYDLDIMKNEGFYYNSIGRKTVTQ